jgi:hypothetical protein
MVGLSLDFGIWGEALFWCDSSQKALIQVSKWKTNTW